MLGHPVPTDDRMLGETEVQSLHDRAMARIAEGNVAKNDPRRREAEGRIRAARKFLWDPKRARQHARNAIERGLRPVIRRLTCPIDVGALREYVAGAGPEADTVPNGKGRGETRRELARALADRVGDSGTVVIRYSHSQLGAQLYSAGFVDGSREYAVSEDRQLDPFAMLPSDVRKIALGAAGSDFDDNASFQRSSLQVVDNPHIRDLLGGVARREEILRGVGAYHFPNSTAAEQRKAAKALFNSLDMDGTYMGWRERYRVPVGMYPELECEFDLATGGRFNWYAYKNSQLDAAKNFEQELPAMARFVKAYLRIQGDDERLEHPERTLKSYVLQEAEAISRYSKLCWAAEVGREPVSLQHDGVLLRLWPHDNKAEVEHELSRLCSAALGYEQPVAHKS